MRLDSLPIQEAMVVREGGLVTVQWGLFFDKLFKMLNLSRPWELPSFTVASAPDATKHTGSVVFVSNETGGATVAFSDGTNWRRVQDRAIIS